MSSHKQIVILPQESTGTLYSTPIEISKQSIQCANFSFQTIFTGSPSGSLDFQISNDMTNPTNWTTFTNYTMLISGSQSEPSVHFGRQLGFSYVRLKWIGNASSAGTIQSNFTSII